MSDIDLVIKISEKEYKKIIEYGECDYLRIINAIENGAPLPEGHGRLVDADNMKTLKNIQSANFNAVELIRLWIDKQDTIIEADKKDEVIVKYEAMAEESAMRAGFETDNLTYTMSESERKEYRENAKESRQIAGWLKDLQQLKVVLSEIKEELHTPNRGTCDYFILDRIDEIIDEYETKKEKENINEEKDNKEKEDLDIEEER